MLVPLSWLREYVPVKMPLPKLVERLSEAGIGVENIHKKEEDTILELEITPNRPDLLSIVGIAREVAAIQKTKAKLPSGSIPKPKKKLPLTIKNNYELCERFTGIVITDVEVKTSPLWISERLSHAGLRPINNIVDVTNYVMLELGNPIHAFDYDQIQGHVMTVEEAKGGEAFTSVDNIAYKLPKGAIVIWDKKRIIDLCGIKGGANTGISSKTKTIFLRVPVDDGKKIRRTSQALALRSEASSIFERGVNKGGTLDALARATSLILKLAGGHVASDVFDLKRSQFTPWHVELSLARLAKVLGITIEEQKVMQILTALNLQPRRLTKQQAAKVIACTIPTYRNDLQIEEDLIEEVARLYGYNKFPKTLPKGDLPIAPIPYESDFEEELRMKQVMIGLGFSEANTYSLVSREDTKLVSLPDEEKITVANPVSREFEIMRPSLLINLIHAIAQNSKHHESIRLFELGNIYRKKDEIALEKRSLAAVLYPADYFDAKGIVEVLFQALAVPFQVEVVELPATYQKQKAAALFVSLPVGKAGKERVGVVGEIHRRVLQPLGIEHSVACFEFDIDVLTTVLPKEKIYKPIPKYPPLIEDLSIVVGKEVLTGKLIDEIKTVSSLVVKVEFLDVFENTRTFRITYQDPKKNLSTSEVADIRRHLLRHLKKKFGAQLKT